MEIENQIAMRIGFIGENREQRITTKHYALIEQYIAGYCCQGALEVVAGVASAFERRVAGIALKLRVKYPELKVVIVTFKRPSRSNKVFRTAKPTIVAAIKEAANELVNVYDESCYSSILQYIKYFVSTCDILIYGSKAGGHVIECQIHHSDELTAIPLSELEKSQLMSKIHPRTRLEESLDYILHNRFEVFADSMPNKFLRAWMVDDVQKYRHFFLNIKNETLDIVHIKESPCKLPILPVQIFLYVYAVLNNFWVSESDGEIDSNAFTHFQQFQTVLAGVAHKRNRGLKVPYVDIFNYITYEKIILQLKLNVGRRK